METPTIKSVQEAKTLLENELKTKIMEFQDKFNVEIKYVRWDQRAIISYAPIFNINRIGELKLEVTI
jgi:hypothetical protein